MNVPLREYLELKVDAQDQKLLALEKLADAKQEAVALAVEKQAAANNARFEGVNEWRQTFGDLASRGVTREVFDAHMKDIERRLHDQEQWQARTNGQFAAWGVALLVLSTIIGIISRFINLGA